MKDKNLMLTL